MFIRWVLTLALPALMALSACANGAGDPAPETGRVMISGQLTLKGSEPGAWWAVTDDQGRIWKIASPTPEQLATLQKLQNQRISMEGRRLENYLSFEQVQPTRIFVRPNS